MVTSREIQLKSRPVGMPSAENFELATVPISDPAAGEVQVKNIWMTVDPYMRGRMVDRPSYVPPFQLGKTLQGGAIGEVIASNDPLLKRGDLVSTMFGWREYFNAPVGSLQTLDTFGAAAPGFSGCSWHAGPDGFCGPGEDRGPKAWRRGVCLSGGRRRRLGRLSDRQDQRAHSNRIGRW